MRECRNIHKIMQFHVKTTILYIIPSFTRWVSNTVSLFVHQFAVVIIFALYNVRASIFNVMIKTELRLISLCIVISEYSLELMLQSFRIQTQKSKV